MNVSVLDALLRGHIRHLDLAVTRLDNRAACRLELAPESFVRRLDLGCVYFSLRCDVRNCPPRCAAARLRLCRIWAGRGRRGREGGSTRRTLNGRCTLKTLRRQSAGDSQATLNPLRAITCTLLDLDGCSRRGRPACTRWPARHARLAGHVRLWRLRPRRRGRGTLYARVAGVDSLPQLLGHRLPLRKQLARRADTPPQSRGLCHH